MKKIVIFSFAMMAVLSANAQLSVNGDGDVFTKSIFASFYNTNASNGTLTGISSSLQDIGQKKSIAFTGLSSVKYNDNITTRIAIGVKGRANHALGKNYGIYGECIPLTGDLNYGAAIYGTYKTTPVVLSDNYAGYFDGRVEISEGLVVHGFLRLNGTILSPSTKNNNLLIEPIDLDRSESLVSNRLTHLRMGKFSIDKQEQTYAESDIDDSEMPIAKQSEELAIEKSIYNRMHYGLSTDDLEDVFPDLVYENEDGTKSINYMEMVPILVQAINELSAKVETLQGSNTAKKTATRGTTNIDGMGENVMMLSLGQNKPNPFGTTTSIDVCIPDDVQNAFIYVYDLQGKKVDQVDVTARGKQTIQLDAAILSDGMYLYSLIVDGKVVETRRMIVEK